MMESWSRLLERMTDLINELGQKTEPADTQLVGGVGALTIASGQVAGLGNNTLITPTAGKRLRVYYAAYNATVAVEAAFRFGATGTLWLRNNITANSVIAKDFGDFRFVQGAIDEVLILNLSLALATNWNIFYVEA